MAVPKKRKSKAKAAQVKAGKKSVNFLSVTACTNCGSPSLPHQVCSHCGYYNGRVYDIKSKKQNNQQDAA